MVLLEQDYELILASKSPRRSQLLGEAGLPFRVQTQDVEEDYPAEMPVAEVPVFLAQKKARAARIHLQQEKEIILAADSVVILDDTIYGKPVDEADARRILRELSGREHRVITGVCLINQQREIAFGDTTKVKFAELSDQDIEYYIHNYQPFDKAGSYAIQEWIGLCKVEKIEGTYANVMGLPVERVWKALEEMLG
ncbi:MAG: Maf family nucleotide pyrophosphatase [Bacteroidota bacterium]